MQDVLIEQVSGLTVVVSGERKKLKMLDSISFSPSGNKFELNEKSMVDEQLNLSELASSNKGRQ
jgi:hypothetical protein